VRGARGDFAGLMGLGFAAMVTWVWFPYRALLVTGAVVVVVAGWGLVAVVRRSRDWHDQDVLIRRLWRAVKRIPSGYVLADPATGELLMVERERGCLTLAVSDPPDLAGPVVVTRYLVGMWAAPVPPPLFAHLAGVDDVPPARWGLVRVAQDVRNGDAEDGAGWGV